MGSLTSDNHQSPGSLIFSLLHNEGYGPSDPLSRWLCHVQQRLPRPRSYSSYCRCPSSGCCYYKCGFRGLLHSGGSGLHQRCRRCHSPHPPLDTTSRQGCGSQGGGASSTGSKLTAVGASRQTTFLFG